MGILKTPDKHKSAKFPAKKESLPEIRTSLVSFLESAKIPAELVRKIWLAAEEVCSNIIRHAYLYGAGEIEIELSVDQSAIQLALIDKGQPFDPLLETVLSLDKSISTGRQGGMGLHLVKKLMDRVEYKRENNSNNLTLTKFLKTPPQPKPVRKAFSLKTRIMASTSLALLTLVLVFSVLYLKQLDKSARNGIFSSIYQLAQTLAQNAAEPLSLKDDLTLASIVSRTIAGRNEIAYALIVDQSGTIWADAENSARVLSKYFVPFPSSNSEVRSYLYNSLDYGPVYHFSAPLILNNVRVGTVHIGIFESAVSDTIHDAKKDVPVIATSVFLLGLIGTYFVAGLVVLPIKRLRQRIQQAESDRFDLITDASGKEVGELLRAYHVATQRVREAQKIQSDQKRQSHEQKLAEEIRSALIPKENPRLPDFQITSLYKVAANIGGDYFDFIQVDPDHVGVAVADIAGKGVAASFLMSAVRTALRLEGRGQIDPAGVLDRIDEFISKEIPRGMFVTMFYAIVNQQTFEMKCASAGHNPALVYKPGTKKLMQLNPRGVPLGLNLPDQSALTGQRRSISAMMEESDTLILYTDGIPEATNRQGIQYGMERFSQFIQMNADETPESFVRKLDHTVADFTGSDSPKDDITLVFFKRKAIKSPDTSESRRETGAEEQSYV